MLLLGFAYLLLEQGIIGQILFFFGNLLLACVFYYDPKVHGKNVDVFIYDGKNL